MEIEYIAIAVDDFVGWIAGDADEFFDCGLLFAWQIVMDDVVANEVVLFDDILPRLVATAVAQVQVNEVKFFEPFIFLRAF